MTSELATEIAEAIVDDFKGPGYYKDPAILASFLDRRFGATGEPGKAQEVAQTIVDDINGAAFYMDPKILAQFLDGQGLG